MVGASDHLSTVAMNQQQKDIITTQNGVGQQMQQHQQPTIAKVGPKQLINQHEYLRLIEQALYKLGYDAVARQLEQESVRSAVWIGLLKMGKFKTCSAAHHAQR
eukprot:1158347-Pelagomonas_calceolata.AAC.5